MIRRALSALAVLTLLLLVALGGIAAYFWQPVAPPAPVTVSIRAGESFARVARELADTGVVRAALPLRLLARARGLDQHIQAGDYAFSLPATPDRVLERLTAGDVIQLKVTIPEGWTLREIAARLGAEGLADAGAILALAHDPAFLRSLGVAADSLEGYLFPETYQFARGTPPQKILAAMVAQTWRHLTPELLAAARRQGLDRHQLLTLASIVQKEAGNNREMPLIAAVFHNRLVRHIPLQADPTVIYGIPDFDGNLTRAQLETKTPYNTYRIVGLPPGPIASPGEVALQAAAHPAAVDYLYFVARGDGTHRFSLTLEEHNRAVRRYQLHR